MNETGIVPVEYKVLIKIDEIDDKSSGGILLPENTREREQMAHDRGTLIEASDMAFSDWKGLKPEAGDKVIFNKYAGTVIQFRREDRTMSRFRLCNDKDVCAVIKEAKQ